MELKYIRHPAKSIFDVNRFQSHYYLAENATDFPEKVPALNHRKSEIAP